MVTVSNSLSFFRAPLAFLFLQESSTLRILAIFLAMITDCVDGYLARRYKSTSQFGAILDPAMDKFFVYFVMSILFMEGKIAAWEVGSMLSRDLFLCLYGFFMLATKRWKSIIFRAIRWGKVTTALQFFVLIALVIGVPISWFIFMALILIGALAFLELMQLPSKTSAAIMKNTAL
jgi:CDP-diacylglycerol--glycerol-3-phosphate 3-phosphatidyltransferase